MRNRIAEYARGVVSESGDAEDREVADVGRIALSIVNAYLVGPQGAADREWALVDAGLSTSGPAIRLAAERRFGAGSRPGAIVLTHGHFDHVGALIELADAWQAPIFAHPLEMPYLTGLSSYPPPDPSVGGGAMAFLSRFYSRGPIDLGARVRELPDDESVPAMSGWRWIPTPGHSPGHVSFLHEEDRAVIVGDAFVTADQESMLGALLKWPDIQGPPAYFTPDWEAAGMSVARLANLDPEVAYTGHGLPVRGETLHSGLERLVRDWTTGVVPSHGRYVGQPAETGKFGVLDVPPPVFDRNLLVVGGLGLASLLAGLALRRGEGDA